MQFHLNPVGGFDQLDFRWTPCASPRVAHLHWLLQIEKRKLQRIIIHPTEFIVFALFAKFINAP